MDVDNAIETAVTVRRGAKGRRRGRLAWLPAAFVLALIAVLAVAVLRPAQSSPLAAYNRPAPAFSLPLYGGGRLNLQSLRGKTVVLNFWWSGCPPCVQEAPILERQWRYWQHRGVVFVGVDEQDDPASAAPRRFLREHGVTYPNGWDAGDVDIQYGTTGQPETVFITPQGIWKNKYAMPFPDDATLSHLIAAART